MNKLTNENKLELGAYIVTLALAVPCYFLALGIKNDDDFKGFLMNISATFAGAAFLFFLLNRFFGLNMNTKKFLAKDFFTDKFPDFKDEIYNSKFLSIVGITLSRTSVTYLDDFQKCIDRGGNIRILVVNPKGKVAEVAPDRLLRHQDFDKFQTEFEHALGNFDSLKVRNGGSFEIKFLNSVPPFSIWLFGNKNRDYKSWVELYSYRSSTNPTFNLELNHDRVWFDFFNAQFEQMWENAAETSK